MSFFELGLIRNVLLCSMILLCFSPAPASAQLAITTPILSTAPNFRDVAGIAASLGGTGFVNPVSNFGLMRQGVFYRSSTLNLSRTDFATIVLLGIRRDIDLRTPSEINQTPDVTIPGVFYTNINVFGGPSLPANPLVFPSQQYVLDTFKTGYQTFVTDPNMRAGFRSVLLTMAHDPGPDLFHCSDGKDRTGWAAVLLQSIAGVSPSTIMNDYLATNNYLASNISSARAALLAVAPGLSGNNFNQIFGVDQSYLQAALDQVIASYGSMYGYLTQGLGLTQADIYVLRAKMVYYTTLPGQNSFTGNAASGAAFLNAMQNSPLSGGYTNYNYYLQSSVDEGTLGGVQTQVGGQIHADAASSLLRQSQWLDASTTPYTDASQLKEGETRVWLSGQGGKFASDARPGIASSTEYRASSITGATYRINDRVSAHVGVGYNWTWVESANANANANSVVAALGGRYAFSTLETGPYVEAGADGAWVDYQSKRAMGGGLGTANGSTNGLVYGGRAGLGDVLHLEPFTITPKVGVRVSGVSLGSFKERDSELGLRVNGINKTIASLLFDVDFALDRQQLKSWTLAPVLSLGYERALGNPQVESSGTLYGVAVSQNAAYDSHGLMKAGLGLTAERGPFSMKALGNALVGDEAKSAGISGHLSFGYSF